MKGNRTEVGWEAATLPNKRVQRTRLRSPLTRRPLGATEALFVALVALTACRVDTKVCQVIVLQETPGLSVLGFTDHVGTCTRKMRVPHEYRLDRSEYSVRLAPFQNDSGGIALQATDQSGAALVLDDREFMDAQRAGLEQGMVDGRYRYWVLPAWLESGIVEFAVLDGNGKAIGRESLRFSIQTDHERAMRWGSRGA